MLAAALAAGRDPVLTVGLIAAAGIVVLAFRYPTANLAVLIVLTAVLPYDLLNRLSVAGGTNTPGVLPSDVFLVAGLAWAALTLPQLPLRRRQLWYALAVTAFLVVVAAQFLHGVRAGYVVSVAGQETRALLGLGTCLIALPLLSHRPTWRRLLGALCVAAVLLGAWGLVQWFGNIGFGSSGDVGVRAGVRFTTTGIGQLQGGEFAYPVAVIGCFAALAYGGVRSGWWRLLLAAGLLLNALSCLLTFERSFWLDALAGLVFVLLFAAKGRRRIGMLAATGAAAAVALVALALFAPVILTTAQQRLSSIGSYASDDSVRYRVEESGFVIARIHAHPLTGSGMGATIFWGQPWAQVPPASRNYSHDGYFWLAWKVGVPAAGLIVALMALAVLPMRSRDEDPLSFAVRRGAQGALLGLLVATITFPSFSQLGISPVIGVLLAIAMSPQPAVGQGPEAASSAR